MFWVGFASILVIMLLLFLLMAGSGRLFIRFANFFVKVKVAICTVVFTLLSYVFTLLYSMIAIVSGNIVISTMLCAVFLIFSWYIVEKMYKMISGENNYKGESIEKTLSYKDKNVCYLCALIAVILSSISLYFENENMDYIIVISIVISIWIGAYVPISEIYQGKNFKSVLLEVVAEFRNAKCIVVFTAVISVMFTVVLVYRNDLAQKLNLIIDEIGKGMAAGSILLILWMIVYGLIKGKKSI